jgi:2-amino-4-hydroxy-6-hydroxymethyldihydropteridine diphosphokinase
MSDLFSLSALSTVAYIALGANIGDREANIRTALASLGSTPDTRVVRTSTLIENPAIGGPANSPDFLNGVAEIQTTLAPLQLLHRLLEIERSLGRQRREKWEPRIIDLDLLLYGDQIFSTDELIIPHPLMHTRRFVLEPLAELAPGLVHPILRTSIATLLGALPSG